MKFNPSAFFILCYKKRVSRDQKCLKLVAEEDKKLETVWGA